MAITFPLDFSLHSRTCATPLLVNHILAIPVPIPPRVAPPGSLRTAHMWELSAHLPPMLRLHRVPCTYAEMTAGDSGSGLQR